MTACFDYLVENNSDQIASTFIANWGNRSSYFNLPTIGALGRSDRNEAPAA